MFDGTYIVQAMESRRAIQILEDHEKQEPNSPLRIPVLVLIPFVVELALKSLIVHSRSGQPNSPHDLLTLYDQLNSNAKEELSQRFATEQMVKSPERTDYIDLRTVLDQHRRSYTDWRYLRNGASMSGDLSLAMEVTYALANEYETMFLQEAIRRGDIRVIQPEGGDSGIEP